MKSLLYETSNRKACYLNLYLGPLLVIVFPRSIVCMTVRARNFLECQQAGRLVIIRVAHKYLLTYTDFRSYIKV
jgi:hypothetical protein